MKLPWTPQALQLIEDDARPDLKKTLGTLWCSDGDGMWTMLLVAPGEEFVFRPPPSQDPEVEAQLEEESPYGMGWGRIGGASRPGCYIFDQGRLVSALLHLDNPDPVADVVFDVEAETRVGLAAAEQLMLERDPGLYEHLLFAEPTGVDAHATVVRDELLERLQRVQQP